MAFERVHGRQSRCENDVVDMNSKIKDLSRSFVNMATDSRATITNSFVKNSDSRFENLKLCILYTKLDLKCQTELKTVDSSTTDPHLLNFRLTGSPKILAMREFLHKNKF